MKKFAFYLVIGSIAAIFLSSCEEVIDWDLMPERNEQLVVEAILTNENIHQQIRLSKSFSQLNGVAEPITNAEVFVRSSDGTIRFFSNPVFQGVYFSEQPFAGRKDVTYHLTVVWQNQTYTASEELSFVSPLEEIKFAGLPPDSLTIQEIGPLYHPLEQAMYEVIVYWQHIVASPTSWAQMYFYTFNTIDGNELIRPEKEPVHFPLGSIIIVKKLGLSEGFGDYLRTVAMETEWQGSAFDEASSSTPTNISNGGLGYFSVCAVVADTIIAR